MRTASVADGEGTRLAAVVSLVLASAKIRDHVTDGDGLLARRPVAAAAQRVAAKWARSGGRTATDLGFDTAALTGAVARQTAIEVAAHTGTPLLVITEPTETATAAAFGHTAVLADRPANIAPLKEAGRLFGRLAHLLDAVEDLEADSASGAWNPITATGTAPAEVRRLCDDAVQGVRLALREVGFAGEGAGRLAHVLLAHELPRAVDRAFGATCSHGDGAGYGPANGGGPYGPGGGDSAGNPYGSGGGGPYGPSSGGPYGDGSQNPYGGPGGAAPGGPGTPGGPGGGGGGGPERGGSGGGEQGGCGDGSCGRGDNARYPRKRGRIAGCAVWTGMFCTCQVCCREKYDDPWRRRKKREGWCHKCDCGSCDCPCDCDCGC
jgi:hypothetical protein